MIPLRICLILVLIGFLAASDSEYITMYLNGDKLYRTYAIQPFNAKDFVSENEICVSQQIVSCKSCLDVTQFDS